MTSSTTHVTATTQRITRSASILIVTAMAACLAATGTVPQAEENGGGRVLSPDRTASELRSWLLDRAPRFTIPADTTGWLDEAEATRRRLIDEVMLKNVPPSWTTGETKVVWQDVIDMGGYRIRKLRYEVLPGLWAGGLLYEPAGVKGKVPAVLDVNGHVGEPGMFVEFKQRRCINLAKRGMLSLNLEWIGMGQLTDPGNVHWKQVFLDMCGVPGISVFHLSMKRGLDILCGHKAADPERIAVTGLSGGGWQTIVLSALDTRVRLAAPNAGFITLPSRIAVQGDVGDPEQNAADMLTIADYDRMVAMLAPRPTLLIYNAEDDCCFRAERARPAVFDPVAPLWSAYGRPDDVGFHINYDPGTHNYDRDNREAFYRFLNRHFLPDGSGIDTDIDVEKELKTPDELAIDYPADNATFVSIAGTLMESLPREPAPTGGGDVEAWRRTMRPRLEKVVRPLQKAAVSGNPARVRGVGGSVNNVTGLSYTVPVAGGWTLPATVFGNVRTGGEGPITLVLADNGRTGAYPLLAETAGNGALTATADILFTGECRPEDRPYYLYAEMLSTVGDRPLGIQASQVEALVRYLRARFNGRRLDIKTSGPMSGLAALVCCALEPELVGALDIHGLDGSLKDLVRRQDMPLEGFPLFCFGLLECADIADLAVLASPTAVTIHGDR